MSVDKTLDEDFLAHLIAAGIIDEQQAVAALDRQREAVKPIGRMALDVCILTVQQVFEILDHQSDAGGLFGEIAIAKGFMTESERDHLLHLQREMRPSIGRVLGDLGHVTEDVLQEQRRAYLRKLEAVLA